MKDSDLFDSHLDGVAANIGSAVEKCGQIVGKKSDATKPDKVETLE